MLQFVSCTLEKYEPYGLFIGSYLNKYGHPLTRNIWNDSKIISHCLVSLEYFQKKYNSAFTIENYEEYFNISIGTIKLVNRKYLFQKLPDSFETSVIFLQNSDLENVKLVTNYNKTDLLKWLNSPRIHIPIS